MAVSTFQGALREHLTADAGVYALVANRVYSRPAPMNLTADYVVMQLISETDVDGTLSSGSGVQVDRWQFDIYAKDIDDAHAIKLAIFEALNYVRHVTMSGYKVFLAKRESGVDNWDSSQNGAEDGWSRITQDYMIKHRSTQS
jgi:hypothetical protein